MNGFDLDALFGPHRHTLASETNAPTYLSTSFLHGEHAHCASMVGVNGTKRPATCKYCEARCICTCHQEVPEIIELAQGA